MRIDMTNEERDILIRWKKRSDTYRLVRMKAEAILHAWRGVGLDTVAEMVERTEETVREWLSQWRQARLRSVVTGHAVGGNAAKFKRAQKEELEEILGKSPSEAGAWAGFWDVPALKDVVSIKFGVEYRSESS
ncbi:helix-turn-helix domain-containing protein [Actinomyces israelii]|uniref:Helix-turn-helix domain-containing protein n=1 Tax=Actinomyces israelii TaxID=1659 RepID=A0ABT4I674_9ACTO|nr:helix-turn-helix domain-containing protein [Actinomyces israelii]MCZ0857214.1 helix-turn-helix domain-containing protein [Actinomyces israelii]